MIVVTSNWAIGDGTLAPAVEPALGGFMSAVQRAVVRAGVRPDGTYRPIDHLEVVLAGDTFDWLLSAEWLGHVRPWNASAGARETLARVVRRSVLLGRSLLRPLFQWARHGVRVPAFRGGGQDVVVPVRVTMLTGDRDDRIEEACGNRARLVSIGRRWDDGRVAIRHGHEFDPLCSAPAGGSDRRSDRSPTLAESVAVDLVARFAATIAPHGRSVIRRLAAAGPLGLPAAIKAGCVSGLLAVPERTGDAWRRSVDVWWRIAQRCVPTVEAEFDAVDALAVWLRGAFAEDAATSPPSGLGGLVPGRARGAAGAVYGHLEGNGLPTSAVGLGGRAATVGCRDTRGWPRWDVLTGESITSAVVAVPPSAFSMAAGDCVIDAA